MEQQLELELFKAIAKRFHAFIADLQNDKILFSGRYGAGKTSFLNVFFQNPETVEIPNLSYVPFRISPVNYSVASNEDIIELIKYDIVTEFLTKKIEILTSDIPSYQVLSEKDITPIFKMMLSLLSYKGIELGKVINELGELKKHLDKKKMSLDEGDQFVQFLQKIEGESNIFERNIITQLIENVLSRLTKSGKEPVLIIDDFDRMDPDHIFRVLNVFSAHLDNETLNKRGQMNKFGFAKIIIVCDHKNLESLFHTRYGADADFSGYLDKFYQRLVFEFDIKNEIRDYVRTVLFGMDKDVVAQYQQELNYFDRNSDELLQDTVIQAIIHGELSLRTLLKLRGFNVVNHFDSLNFLTGNRNRPPYTLFLLQLNLFLFGGPDKLLKVIQRLFVLGVPLSLDRYLLNIFIIGAKRFDKRQPESELTINTSLARYTFMFDGQNWSESNRQTNPGSNPVTTEDLNLDLISYFLKRIGKLTNLKG